MGNFYTNITLYRADRAKALTLLKGRNAAVSPTLGEFTVIWDDASESQDVETLAAVTKRLSHGLDCPALAVLNHDDDVLLYLLFSKGEKVDQYNSCPEFFGDSGSEPQGGKAALLAKIFGAESAAESVEHILRNRDRYLFAIERHQALIDALGMPGFGVGMGYRYLTSGELPPGLEDADAISFCE